MNKPLIFPLISVLLFSLLTGCSNHKFDCPYTDGVHCKSLSEVDQQVDNDQAGKEPSKKTPSLKKLEPKKVPDSPLRTQEEVLSLWVAPYQTEDGTYHEEKLMHFVARPAEWAGAVLELQETH